MVIFLTLLGGVWFLFPVMFGSKGRPTDWSMWGLLCINASFGFVPAVLLALWTARAQIVADDNGLRWRSLGRWRAAAWADVTDYYEKFPVSAKQSSSGPRNVVETAAGRLTFDRDWSGYEDLRAALEQRAKSARTQSWGVKGTRLEDDWPRVFDYNTPGNKAGLWLIGAALALMYGVLLGPMLVKAMGWVRELGWGLGLAPTLVAFVFIFSYSLLFWAAAYLPLEAKQRKQQRITVSPSRLRFEDGCRTLDIPCDAVSDYFTASFPPKNAPGFRYVVVTSEGSFDFTPAIRESRLLAALVRQYATTQGGKDWSSHDWDEVIGGQHSRWSGGCEGVGERVFHYRTRTNRALLWFQGAFAVLPVVPFVLYRWLGLPMSSSSDSYTFSAVAGAAFLWTLWRYQAARIQVDGHGITQDTVRGKRFVAWDEVQDYYKSGSDVLIFGNVVGTNGRVRFWLGIADAAELQEEISHRAVHSRSREWKEKEKEKEKGEGVTGKRG